MAILFASIMTRGVASPLRLLRPLTSTDDTTTTKSTPSSTHASVSHRNTTWWSSGSRNCDSKEGADFELANLRRRVHVRPVLGEVVVAKTEVRPGIGNLAGQSTERPDDKQKQLCKEIWTEF